MDVVILVAYKGVALLGCKVMPAVGQFVEEISGPVGLVGSPYVLSRQEVNCHPNN